MSELTLDEIKSGALELEEEMENKKRFKHFLWLFTGQQISLLGSSIVSFAIVWWLTITTQSEMMLGIASLVALGPFVFIAPISGVLADKYNRKMLLIIMDSAQAILTVILAVLFLTSNVSVAVMLVMLGLRGVAQAFHTPVSMSIAPTMVPQKHLSRINGVSYLFSGLINIIGPALGAGLLAIPGVTIGMILWIDVITFAIAVIPLILVRIPSGAELTNEEEIVKEEKKSFIGQFTEGFSALKGIKGMLALLFGAMAINFLMSPLGALMPLFVNKIHGGSELNYAVVIGMFQAAIVIGGILMSIFKGFKKPVLLFFFTITFQALLQTALTFIPTDFIGRFWIMGGILFVYALPFAVIDVSFITSIQLLVPKEKLGRVMATIMAISPAMRPLGQFLSGVIAEFTGINAVLIASAILCVIVFGLIYFFTPIRQVDKAITELVIKTNGASKDAQIEEEKLEELFDEDESASPKYLTNISETAVEATK